MQLNTVMTGIELKRSSSEPQGLFFFQTCTNKKGTLRAQGKHINIK